MDSLMSDPSAIYKSVEANLAMINGSSAATLTPGGSPCLLFWAEHRSRSADYRSHLNWSWLAATAWRAAMDNRHEEVRSRLALMCAAAEQVSLDGGSWTLAWQFQLHAEPPPVQSFASHNASSAETPSTRLLDERWVEVHHQRLKELDDMRERRKRLEQRPGGAKAEYAAKPKWPPKGGKAPQGAEPPAKG
jgi:hypothetical protein